MPEDRCGATTLSGGTCRWAADRCPHHSSATPLAPGKARGPSEGPPPSLDPRQQPWYAGRDLRQFAWWVVERLLEGSLERQTAAVLVAVMRVLVALGPEPLAQEEALREVELLGTIMNGIPPRNPAEWEHAMRLFDDDAVAEFSRWEPLLPGAG